MNIPEGWKLVPQHWTEEVAEAMADAFSANCGKEVIDNWLHLRPMYEAALAAAPTPPAQEFEFQVGDKVEKCTGDYHLEGVVVGHAVTLKGKVRYVVEHQPVAPGMLHIYSAANLRKI